MTVRDTLRALAPVLGQGRTQKLWHGYLAAGSDARRELEASLEAYAARVLNDHPSNVPAGLFPPPPPETCIGDIDLGTVRYGGKGLYLFGLRKEELLRHVGAYGSSGSGKSNGIAIIVDGLVSLGIPFLLIDFKRTFRALIKDHPGLLVFTAGDNDIAPFRMNPLIPPAGTNVEVWSKKVIAALSHAYCQGAGSESLLVSALAEAYRAANEADRWPTFQDVAEVLETQPARGRRGMWLDSAKRAVTSIATGNAGEVFCPQKATDLARVLHEPVILEMDLLNQSEQTFLSEVLLLYVIHLRMNQNAHRESLQHAIIIEEAHHLLRAPPSVGDGSEPVIHTTLREVRELGESIILATQNSSIVPVAVFGNQATTLAFHTKHQKDLTSTSQGMLLKDEAKDELGRLPVGEAIIRVPRWPDPVIVRLKLRRIAKGTVADADIARHMQNRDCSSDTSGFHHHLGQPAGHPEVPRPDEYQEKTVKSPSTQSTQERADSPTTTPNYREKDPRFPEPSSLETALMKDILLHPFDGVVKRIERLQISRRKGVAALAALVQRCFIEPAPIYTGANVVKLFDCTPAGRLFCNDNRLGTVPQPMEGKIEHRYWVEHVATRLAATGWTTKKEYRVSDVLTVDVAAEQQGRHVAILVETGKSDVRGNVEKTAQAGFTEIWVVTANPKVLQEVDRIKKQMTGTGHVEITVKTPTSF